MSALGDIVHALPVLDYLHQASPGIEVDWVVEESFREILEGNPLISQSHIVRTKVWRKHLFSLSVWNEISVVKTALQNRKYDFVFDIQGNIKSGVVSWLSDCKRRYGFAKADVRESLNTRFINNCIPLRRQDYHISDRALRVISVPFGKDYTEFSLHTDISTSLEDDLNAETFIATLSDSFVIVIHHGTTWKTKLWYEEGWVELGKRLLKSYPDANILLSWGGEEEHKTAQSIAEGIKGNARLLPELSLKGLTAIYKKVDLVIGGDTGPLHIAAAVGTPTVSLYRATDGKRNGPRGDLARIVQSPLPCTKCLNKECKRDSECKESITVDMMQQACDELLAFNGDSSDKTN